MTSSPRRRRRVSKTAQQAGHRIVSLRLVMSLVAALALAAGLIAGFARTSTAQADQTDSENLFSEKADKVLKQVRRALRDAESSRPPAAGRQLPREVPEIESLSRTIGIQRNRNNQVTVDVAVRLTSSSAHELEAAGFRIAARVGDVATFPVEVNRLPELAALGSVRKIFAAVHQFPSNDRARVNIGAEDTQGLRLVSQTGRGVLLAVIDSGIDFRHLDFTVPGSGGRQTRIKALLDMTVYESQTPDPGWDYTLPGQSTPIGRLYTETDINAALQLVKPDQNVDSIKQRDKSGHGTHVAGTAAGNGQSSPTAGTYSGVAHEADLIIVKASRQNDGDASFRTTDIINALQFVHQKALERNQPLVINLSLGGHLGPHDGTNPEERVIDNLVNSGPGRSIVVAAGNEGDAGIHASGTVPAGGSLTIDLDVQGDAKFVDLYHQPSDRFTVTVTRPDGLTLGPIAYGPGEPTSDEYLQVFNTNDDKGDTDPTNDQPDIFLAFKAGASRGVWKITLTDADGNSNKPFDAWTEGDGAKFTSQVDNIHHLIASPGTARGALTVAAYVTRSANLMWGSPAMFSSPGPTADGRLKPEVSAPGHYLYSARSTDIVEENFGMLGTDINAPTDSTHYAGLAGTSMAAPVTAGGVALMLQSNSSLTGDQIKDSIKNTTRPGYTSDWDRLYGFGKLDIKAAIALNGQQTFTISGHVTSDSSSATLTLNGSQSGTASIDSLGNYKFRRLLAGGTYTITPSISSPYQYNFSPPNQTFSNLSGDQVANFTALKNTYTASGHVRDRQGRGVAGITIKPNFTSALFATTDANGYYILTLPAGTNYMIAALHSDYSFEGGAHHIQALSKDLIALDFIAIRMYEVSGRVTDQAGNPLKDISVEASGGRFSPYYARTDSNGNYRLYSLDGGSNYVISASGGFIPRVYSPNNTVLMNLSEHTVVNFVGRTVNGNRGISGRVVDLSGSPVAGVRVDVSGSVTGATLSDKVGFFAFWFLEQGGNYTISPSSPNYSFEPSSISFSNLQVTQQLELTARPSSAHGEIRLSQSSYSLTESGGSLLVTVSRSEHGMAANVDYSVSDASGLNDCGLVNGSASARCDYGATRGTFRFAIGEDSKSILIPIVDDAYAEGNESFTVAVTNPVGASLGSASSAVVTIVDNDAVNGPNPLNNVDFFVRQQYVDFLGREPDPAGLQGWRNVLNNCGTTVAAPCDQIEVSAGFFRSLEFQQRGYFIYRFYSTVGKIPLYHEFMPDLAKVSGFLTDQQLESNKAAFVKEFTNRPEFQAKYSQASTSSSAFVEALLQTVELPNHPSKTAWITLLNMNENNFQARVLVLRELVESPQVFDKYYNEAFVIMQYFGYLRRTADASYINWIQTMNQTKGDYRTMIDGFLNSSEYRRRFGP